MKFDQWLGRDFVPWRLRGIVRFFGILRMKTSTIPASREESEQ